jgi:methionyl-tRNA formyltransferase
MRVLFAGSPAIAVPSLKAVSDLELEGKEVILAGVLTNPDSRRGRHGREEPTDVSAAALELDLVRKKRGLPSIVQLKPERLDASCRKDLAALEADLLVSFAYGRFFGPRFLELFPLGGIKTHPSLLPRYRGASPVPAVILGREKETGICIQKLAAELDSGDILSEEKIELSGRETAFSLSEIVSQKAAILLRELLLDFGQKSQNAWPQQGEAVYCREIKKEEGLIDWSKSAVLIDAQIRAFMPWPLSFTRLGKDTLFILEARPVELADSSIPLDSSIPPGTILGTDKNLGILIQTGDGILAVTRLKRQTKNAMDWKAFLNGERNFTGSRLE